MSEGRIVVIPFLHGKLNDGGQLIEPDIDAIFQKWLERHPEFDIAERDFQVIRSNSYLNQGIRTKLVRVTAAVSSDLASYDPNQDVDLYENFLAEDLRPDRGAGPASEPHKIWIEQCIVAEQIECDFGTQEALKYLVGQKFLNFLEAAETMPAFRAEIPDFVANIRKIFEKWQLAEYLEVALESEPFAPGLFVLDEVEAEDEEYDPDEIEEMRRDDIRECTRELLLVERAKEWLLD